MIKSIIFIALLCFTLGVASRTPFLPFFLRSAKILNLQLTNQTNSGIALAISDNFYKNISNQFLTDLSGVLRTINIPDYTVQNEILFMDFIFKVSNITIGTINFDSQNFFVDFQNDNTTTVNIMASELKIPFNYLIQYGLIDIQENGYIDLQELSINFNVDIKKNDSNIDIALTSMFLDYSSLYLNFGDYFDKKILAFMTEKIIDLIWPLISTSISSSLKSTIQQNLDTIAKEIPFEIDLPDSDVSLDLSLLNDPFVLGNYFIINLNGDFYKTNSTPEVLVPPIPFQVNLTENISQIFLHQITINSLFQHVFSEHILNYTIFGNITNGFGLQLDSRTIDGLFPELKSMSTQEISFRIENPVDYQPRISFIQGDENSRSHINLKANVTASLYLSNNGSEFSHYVTGNFTISADFKILTLKEGFALRTNNIQLLAIETADEDAHKINKAGALKDGNILLNLGVSDLNKELYKKVLKFPNVMSLNIKCLKLHIYDTYIVADVELDSSLRSIMQKKLSKNRN